MHTGLLQADGSTAGRTAPPLRSITGEASGGGKGVTLPAGGFPAVLGALTSQQMAHLTQAAEGAEAQIRQGRDTSSAAPLRGSSDDEGPPVGAILVAEDASLSGRLAFREVSGALAAQAAPATPPPPQGTAEADAGHAKSQHSRPRNGLGKDGSVETETQTHTAPSAATPFALSQTGTAIIPVLPVPILTPVAPLPSKPQPLPGILKAAGAAGTLAHGRGSTGPAADALGMSAARNLEESTTLDGKSLVPGEAAINPPSPRGGTALVPAAPHRAAIGTAIGTPAALDEKSAGLPGARVQPSSYGLNRDATTPVKSGGLVGPRTPEVKTAESSFGTIAIATAPAANAVGEAALPMHAGPGHGNTAIAAEIGGAHGTNQSGSSGTSLANENPFHRLDSLSPDPSLHLRSRGNMIEAGVESASYGWIEVKATSSAGLVSASIHANDAIAAPAIQNHLQGLSNFLSEQAIPMREVTIGAGLTGQNGEGRNHHSGGNEERQAGPGTTRAPTPPAVTSAAEGTSSSVISLHA